MSVKILFSDLQKHVDMQIQTLRERIQSLEYKRQKCRDFDSASTLEYLLNPKLKEERHKAITSSSLHIISMQQELASLQQGKTFFGKYSVDSDATAIITPVEVSGSEREKFDSRPTPSC